MSKSRKRVQPRFSCYNYYFPKETAVALAECWDVIRYSLRRNTWKVYIQLCLREASVFMELLNIFTLKCHTWTWYLDRKYKMVSRIITTNTLENFLAGVAISSLQHQVFCMTSAATLQVLSVVDVLQQSWCLMSLSFLLELWEVMVAVTKKTTIFYGTGMIVLDWCWHNWEGRRTEISEVLMCSWYANKFKLMASGIAQWVKGNHLKNCFGTLVI